MVVGVLEEPGVHLHLPGKHGLELGGHVVPRRDLVVAHGELGVVGHDAASLLLGEDPLAKRVPAVVELAAVPVGPLERHVVGRVRRTRRVVHEERTVRRQRGQLAHPTDRAGGHVLGEVVALVGGGRLLDRGRAAVEGRRVLVGLAAEESIEVLEAAAAGRPGLERPDRAGLPDRDLVAFAELRRRVAVEPQHLRERSRRLRPDRCVARCGRGDLGDRAHADRVVVAPGQQRLPRRRAQRGGVETGERQPAAGEPLGIRRAARPAEHARRAEAHVVEQHDEDVRRPRRRPDRRDRFVDGARVLGVVVDRPVVGRVGDGEDRAVHRGSPSTAARGRARGTGFRRRSARGGSPVGFNHGATAAQPRS